MNSNSEASNDLYQDQETEDRTFAGIQRRTVETRTSVIYTDYENIAVLYTCFESRQYIMPMMNVFYNVIVRNATFDSLRNFRKALNELQQLRIDFNELLNEIYNLNNCIDSIKHWEIFFSINERLYDLKIQLFFYSLILFIYCISFILS